MFGCVGLAKLDDLGRMRARHHSAPTLVLAKVIVNRRANGHIRC
jgi:hypothetical protein